MEPLQLLRDMYSSSKTLPPEENGEYVFGTVRFPKKKLTAWRSKAQVQGSSDFFDLQELVFFLLHGAAFGPYIKLCTDHNIRFVSGVDKGELLEYLSGQRETSDRIQPGQMPATQDQPARAAGVAAGGPQLSEEQLREAKQRHARNLESASHRPGAGLLGSEAFGQGGASALYSQQNILELRAKRTARKQSHIRGDGDEEEAERLEDGPLVDPAFLDADKPIVAAIRQQERPAADRNSVLRKPGREFKFALDHFQKAMKEGDRRPPSPPKGKEDAHVGSKRPRPDDRQADERESQRPSNGTPHKSSSRSERPLPTPIIITCPDVPGAMLTMYNAVDFLEKGQFVPAADKKKQDPKKPSEAMISRKLPGTSRRVTYRILDAPLRIRDKDWDNVVCVIVHGKAWQFKGYKWDSPVDLFQHALGVNVKYSDIKIDPLVQSWNVRILEINKHKRYLDQGASLEFWRMLDEFMLVHKRNMLPSSS